MATDNRTVILSAGDMSEATLTSSELDLGAAETFALQAVYTDAPVGTLSIQASVDGTNFEEIQEVEITAAGSTLYNMTGAGFREIRTVYTKTSGTGSLTVTVNTKTEE